MRILKANKIILFALTVLLFTIQAKATENYWQTIKQYLKQDDAHPSAEGPSGAKEYLESLSAAELIIAARQCSQEIQQVVKPEEWDMVGGAYLGFFYQYYPLKTNNLKNISALLDELKDNSQSKVWRRYIMHMLGSSWSGKLSVEQSLDAAKIMHEIYRDDSESLLLKPKAISESTELLKHAYSMNLRSDPNVKEFTKKQKMRTRELVNAIQMDKVRLSQQTIKANEKVLAEINKSIMTQLNLFSNKQVDTGLKTSIIVALARYHKYHLDPPQVSQTLANAVNNYKNYDERLWYILLKTNIEDFGNQNAKAKLQNMINEIKNENTKKRLIQLKKRHQKCSQAL